MITLEESKVIKENGKFPYSIALNYTGCKTTPFATHIKVYDDGKKGYFLNGDYYGSIKRAFKSYQDRCSEKGLKA